MSAVIRLRLITEKCEACKAAQGEPCTAKGLQGKPVDWFHAK